jgi:hypothetical protein
MKVSQASPARLKKMAKKYGVKVVEDIEALRKAVKVAIKAKKAAAQEESVDEEPVDEEPVDEEPKVGVFSTANWNKALMPEYFRFIMSAAPSGNEEQDMADLMAVVMDKAKEAKPRITPMGVDCLGVAYASDVTICKTICPLMPLCEHIFKTREDYPALVDAAVAQYEASVKPKMKTPKAAKDGWYKWVGDVAPYLEKIDDKALAKIYKHVAGAERFDMKGLTTLIKDAGYAAPAKMAKMTIDNFLANQDAELMP